MFVYVTCCALVAAAVPDGDGTEAGPVRGAAGE